MYNEIEGNLIVLGQSGAFDVISHGCNCFCSQKSGIAPQMAKAFGTDRPHLFPLESPSMRGDINKLGQIQFQDEVILADGRMLTHWVNDPIPPGSTRVTVVNSYTQFKYGRKNHADGEEKPLDYDALMLCMRKINYVFKGQHIGLPRIGAGLAGGDWDKIKRIIKLEFEDCDVTIVNYKE